jgi:sulfur-oxidizing protein SoxY
VGAASGLAAAIGAGLLKPTQVWAADWNAAAFDAKDVAGALKGIGVSGEAESKEIIFKAPDIAENGAVVPITVESNIANTEQLIVLIEQNPTPLSSSFSFMNGALPSVAVRVKMGKTSNVRVLAKAGGKYYSASKEIKVTIGGCGG